MCLVVVAVRPHPALSLVVAANRDELHARPSTPLASWEARPDVLAGRDLRAGGTWLGVTRGGRFAAVTNVRSPSAKKDGRSRGSLVRGFLESDSPARGWWEALREEVDAFPAFNLVASDGREVLYLNEADVAPRVLADGIHGLSNARLDAPWPKVVALERVMRGAIDDAGRVDTDALFSALRSERRAPDDALPATGVPIELERALSAAFIASPEYGTRCSTVVVRDAAGRGFIEERRFDAAGADAGRLRLPLG